MWEQLKQDIEQQEELSIEIVEDFIDKILIGSYDEEVSSRDIKIIWNFTI